MTHQENEARFQDVNTNYLDYLIAGGFYNHDETLELFLDIGVEDDDQEEFSEDELTALFDSRWNSRLVEQESWGETTGDRLQTVFNELNENNIKAEMNFECCNNCGSTALWNVVKENNLKGYVFFHEQSTERMLDYNELMLYYGSSTGELEDDLKIGQILAQKLKTHGFDIEWDNNANQAIKVPIFWQKKLSL
jgi:hypothetical protein